MTTTPGRDTGKGLDQARAADGHWVIEGYDVSLSWEGTRTSVCITRDGEWAAQARNLSEARRWIRAQVGK